MSSLPVSTPPVTIDPEEAAFLKTLMERFDAYKRRYSLCIAALVSPIALLVDKKLMSRCMSQDHLLKVSLVNFTSRPAYLK